MIKEHPVKQIIQ